MIYLVVQWILQYASIGVFALIAEVFGQQGAEAFGPLGMTTLAVYLASVGTAGVPGAGAIMLMMVLDSVGLKVEAGSPVAMAYAMIFGIDALLDMGRTACNVTGDMAVTCIVAKTEDEMDSSYWQKEDKSGSQLAESVAD